MVYQPPPPPPPPPPPDDPPPPENPDDDDLGAGIALVIDFPMDVGSPDMVLPMLPDEKLPP